jgi:uncharacterized protein (TIGR03437 family)
MAYTAVRVFHVRITIAFVVSVWMAGIASAQTPSVAENGVLNSASYAVAGRPGHAVAPGSLVAIFGSDLAAGLTLADSIPLSTSIAGVTVRMNNTNAPLTFVSSGQVNAQLPWDALPPNTENGTATVVVTRGGQQSSARQFQVARYSPGIFTFPGNGMGPAIIVNASDGSVAQPPGTVPGGFAHRPSSPGEAIIIYANGLGPVDPPARLGDSSTDVLRRTVTTPVVMIGGREATVVFSGLAPEFVGVNQINAVVPAGLSPAMAVPVQLMIGGIITTDLATMAIGN